MSAIPECLQLAIGLTRVDPDCVDDYVIDYSTSSSGLYLDELKGIDLLRFSELGGDTDVWQKMDNARNNAIVTFKVDLFREMSKYLEARHHPFSGNIGQTKWIGSTLLSNYKGLKIFSDVNGATIRIRGFNLMLETTETVTLEVWTEEEQLITYSLTSQAGKNKVNTLATPLELELDKEYFFIYQSNGKVLKNKLTCGCGGFKWCYSHEKPCYSRSRDNWTQWMMVAGIVGSDTSDLDSWSQSHYAHGLSIIADTRCNSFGIICNDGMDFQNDPISLSVAMAILYKSGEYLLDYILDSNEVNRYTLLSAETIDVNRLFFQSRYAEMVNYIAKEVDYNANDCWRCKDKITVRGQRL
jgi:hypothetical protein